MELLFILLVIIAIAMIGILIFIICSCQVSSKSDDKSEYYRMLDPKVLDDDTKDWNIFTYDEKFVKKEDEDERNIKKSIK